MWEGNYRPPDTGLSATDFYLLDTPGMIPIDPLSEQGITGYLGGDSTVHSPPILIYPHSCMDIAAPLVKNAK
jgi:hypothetical protein